MDASAWIVGLHLLSWHDPGCHMERWHCEPYNNRNPGVFARAPSGFTFGGYTNSYGLPSAYAGWTFETADRRFALTVGGVTGYPGSALRPIAVPSVRFGLGGSLALRIAGAPRVEKGGAAVVHMALEWQQ